MASQLPLQQAPKPVEAKKDATDEKAIRALIDQLGDNSFDKREAAAKRLTAIGEAALGLLEKAAKEGADLEMRSRAGQLVQAISKGMFVQVRQMAGVHNGLAYPLAHAWS